MGYYVHTIDELEDSLETIEEKLDYAENYFYEAIDEIEQAEDDYDYYNGPENYEDLTTYKYIEKVVSKFNSVNKLMLEFQEEWNEKIKKLKANAEDKFKYLYDKGIIEVKK